MGFKTIYICFCVVFVATQIKLLIKAKPPRGINLIAKMNQFNSNCDQEMVESVTKVVLGIWNPQDILNGSVCEVLTCMTYEGNKPVVNGLFDLRMGTTEKSFYCETCQQDYYSCPGHFGHITLVRPVYHIHFMKFMLKIARCFCYACSECLVPLYDPHEMEKINRKPLKIRFQYIFKEYSTSSFFRICHYCKTPQPAKWVNPRNHSDSSYGIAKVYAEFSKKSDAEANQMYFSCEQMLEFLRRISNEDLDKIGIPSKSCRPDWMICTVFPVPPPQVRPSVRQENNQKSEDDLTHKLGDIIVKNHTLRDEMKKHATVKNASVIDDWTQLLQYHVYTFVDNESPGMPRAIQRSGRPIKSVMQRLKSKEGRLRSNLMGKRGDYTARTVITGEPNIALDEIGVPLKIAMNLTFPEVVTEKNMERMTQIARNGTNVYPGAKIVVKKSVSKSGSVTYNSYSLRHAKEKTWWPLQKGDIIHRHLRDGDLVLFNRQPSLHKMSMMGHRVRVLEVGNTFRLNVSATTPYNADFDGDEMNLFQSQCMEGVCELKFLTIVHNQIISPQRNQCVIGLVQDTLFACSEITKSNVRISKYNYMNLLLYLGKSHVEIPKSLTGRSLFDLIIPPIDYYRNTKMGAIAALGHPNAATIEKEHALVIKSGKIMHGVVDKGSVGTSPGCIIQLLWNDYSPKSASEFIYQCQKLCTQWLLNVGHSVGLSDCLFLDKDLSPKKSVYDAVSDITRRACSDVYYILNQAKAGLYKPKTLKKIQDEIEGEIMHILNKARSDASKVGVREYLVNENRGNRLVKMVVAGSKGDEANVAQITCLFGQADVSGARAPFFFQNRSLPHFAKFDNSPQARGFAAHSFKEGLLPEEFYFLASSTRIGLIDKTVKTADTGYIQRRLIKSMEDLMVHFDGTVRTANNSVLQFAYGDDYFNAIHLENAHFRYHLLSMQDFEATFMNEDSGALSEEYLTLKRHRDQVLKQMGPRTEFYTPIQIERVLVEIINAQPADVANVCVNENYIWKKKREIDAFLVQYFKISGTDEIPTPMFMFRNYYTFEFASKRMLRFMRKQRASFDMAAALELLVKRIKDKFVISVCPSGEMVGIISSQSIGEPTTQLTLNLFHHIGSSGKSATTGVPRMKELLAASKKIKTPMMTMYLAPSDQYTMEIIQEYAGAFEFTRISDLLSDIAIFFEVDADFARSVVSADDDMLESYREESLELDEPLPPPFRWVVRLEFKHETYYTRGVTHEQILESLDRCFDVLKSNNSSSSSNKFRIADYTVVPLNYPELGNREKPLIIRIYVSFSEDTEGEFGNMWQMMHKITDKFLLSQHVKGIDGISQVLVEQVAAPTLENPKQMEFVIVTSGSRLKDVLMFKDKRVVRGVKVSLDKSRIRSNDVDEMFEVFGIEVARSALIDEFNSVLEGTGGVNMRHITILVDTMTSKGLLIPIDRHGVKKNDIGPLSRATFEETVDQLLKAATFGEADHMNGVSANIMMGQIAPCGTGTVNLILDESKILSGGSVRRKRGTNPQNGGGGGGGERNAHAFKHIEGKNESCGGRSHPERSSAMDLVQAAMPENQGFLSKRARYKQISREPMEFIGEFVKSPVLSE